MDEPNRQARPGQRYGPAEGGSVLARFVWLAVGLGLLWFLLSGRIGLSYLVMMGLSVGLVAFLNADRIYRAGALAPLRLLYYVGWMLWNIVKANVQVARIVLHPRLPIDPALLVFETKLERPGALVMLANSITLTPGTVTVDLEDGRYVVHALVPRTADDILSAELQNVVRAVFAEPPEQAPEVRWVHSARELHG